MRNRSAALCFCRRAAVLRRGAPFFFPAEAVVCLIAAALAVAVAPRWWGGFALRPIFGTVAARARRRVVAAGAGFFFVLGPGDCFWLRARGRDAPAGARFTAAAAAAAAAISLESGADRERRHCRACCWY